ncbi:MAG: tetratricopeptide repeat protein [Verrucomicrobia bacterium]|nr:tetratricopeptide repeat protein [Verrucomicrobiota bacterium]
MTTPANPSSPKAAGDDRKLVSVDETYIAPSFEDKLHLFWKNNGNAVLILCGLVVVGILAKGGWDYLQNQKELDIEKAYAAAANSDQLKAFAAANPEHSLAGIAQLRLADEAYTAGKAADALAGYEKAIAVIKTGPLAARAQLGRALAKSLAGKTADAVTDLKQIAGDTNLFKGVRAEAAYALTSLAAEAGNGADVQKYSTQRALMLRASVPAPAMPSGSAQIKIPGAK